VTGQCQCPWPPPGPVGRDPRAPAPVDLWELTREIAIDLRTLTDKIDRQRANEDAHFKVILDCLEKIMKPEEEAPDG